MRRRARGHARRDAPAGQPVTPPPRAHTRVFVADGGYFTFPLDAYAAIREACRRGADYEGPDVHGALTYLGAEYIRAGLAPLRKRTPRKIRKSPRIVGLSGRKPAGLGDLDLLDDDDLVDETLEAVAG